MTKTALRCRKGALVGFADGSCLKLSKSTQLTRQTVTTVRACNANDANSQLLDNRQRLRQSLRQTVTTLGDDRSTLIFDSNCLTGLNAVVTLMNDPSLIVKSRCGRSDLEAKTGTDKTATMSCHRGSVNRLQRLLTRRESTRHHYLVAASDIFDVSNSLYPLPGVLSLTRRRKTVILISRTRNAKMLNSHKTKTIRTLNYLNHPVIAINALDGTLNDLNNCIYNSQRLVSFLEGHTPD